MICPSCGQPVDASRTDCARCGHTPEYRQDNMPVAAGAVSPWAAPGGWPAGDPDPTTGLPTNGFGDPGQYLAATHQPRIRQYLPVSPVSPGASPYAASALPPKKNRSALPILVLALVLVVTGGGAAAAGYYLGWFGHGTQPSDVLPAATAAYVQIDLDPSLSQKSQAWAFLRDLPQVRRAIADGLPDPKRMIWDVLSAEGSLAPGTDYDTDIRPWLGNRAGVGVLAHGEQPAWVTAIQVTDEGVAAQKLRSLISSNHQDLDVTIRKGYAVVTAHADTAFVSGELEKGTLSGNRAFRSDLAALGDAGVSVAWADLTALAKQDAFGGGKDASAAQGRLAVVLRFSADTLALDGRFFAADAATGNVSGAGVIGTLPRKTGFAVTVSGGAETLKRIESALPGGFSDLLKGSGLGEADLEALFGRNLTIAAPTTTLTAATGASASRTPAVGVRITTDDAARARAALRKLARAGDGARVYDKVDGDVLTAATTRDYLAELWQPKTGLSGYEPFTKAVPDHVKATVAVYLNLVPLVAARDDLGDYADFVKSLRSVGAEAVPDGSGGGSWSVRLVRS